MLIGITTTSIEEEFRNRSTSVEKVSVERVAIEYIDAVSAVGGVAVLLPPLAGSQKDNERAAQEMIEHIDGLILAGGGDIDPLFYGQHNRLSETVNVSPNRDALELKLAKLAHERDIPVLGICRGMQVMNVALGGTLHQDIHSCGLTTTCHQQQPPYETCTQQVRVAESSRLARLLCNSNSADKHADSRSCSLFVNSMHHQAIASLAPNLTVSATSDDGIIEAVEDPTCRFFLGVQWHPEYLPHNATIFEAFVQASSS